MKYRIYLFIYIFLLFTSCSNKNIFIANQEYIKKSVIEKSDINIVGFVNKKINRYQDMDIDNILEINDKYVLASKEKRLFIFSKKKNNIVKTIKLDSFPVIGYIDNNIIAILSIDNILSIYNTKTYKKIFDKKEQKKTFISQQIATIKNHGSKLYIPFLNSKLLVYDKNKNKIIESYNISSKEYFTNINDIIVEKDFVFLYTKYNLFCIYKSKVYFVDTLNITSAKYFDNKIYVSDIYSNIYIFDKKLNIVDEKYFKNADITHIYTYGSNLFFIENSGYMINTDIRLNIKTIFDIASVKKSHIIKDGNILYFNGYKLNLQGLVK
jgi:hypothetical protein